MTCRTCTYLQVSFNSAGKRAPRSGSTYPCTVIVEPPVLPASMKMRWPPARSHMEPNDGKGCPFYKKS